MASATARPSWLRNGLVAGSKVECEMATQKGAAQRFRWFSDVAKVIAIAADIAVVTAVIFVLVQIVQSNQFEKRRVAIDATAPTASVEFLASYTRLFDAYTADPTMFSSGSLRDDLIYVMSVYDNMAILCLNGLADKDLVKQRSLRAMTVLLPILDAMKWPPESRRNFDALVNDLKGYP